MLQCDLLRQKNKHDLLHPKKYIFVLDARSHLHFLFDPCHRHAFLHEGDEGEV